MFQKITCPHIPSWCVLEYSLFYFLQAHSPNIRAGVAGAAREGDICIIGSGATMSASYRKVQRMRISLKLSLWDSGLHQESGNIPGPLPAVTRENHRPRTAATGKAANTCRK